MKIVKSIMAMAAIGVLVLTLSACGGRFVKPQNELTLRPTISLADKEVDVWEIPMHNFLLLSEGLGVPHDIHFENAKGEKVEKLVAYKAYSPEGKAVLIAFFEPGNDYLNRKAIVTSRSGQNFYTLDGAEHYTKDGFRGPKFDWNKIKKAGEYSFTHQAKVRPGTGEYRRYSAMMANIQAQMAKDALRFPSKWERIMEKIGRITTEDVVIGATFPEVYGVIGLRLFAAINILTESADMSLPFYDTAIVKRIDLAIALAPFQDNNEGVKRALEDWTEQKISVDEKNKEIEANNAQYLHQLQLYKKLVAEHKACSDDPARDQTQLNELLEEYYQSLLKD